MTIKAMIKDGFHSLDKNITSFLMIGQSNMAGRGEFDEVKPIVNDRCYMLRNGRWQQMSEPINPDRPIWGIKFHSGVSLAASFADEFTKETNTPVGLIPCADGGTKIQQWMPGETLYEHAVFMTKLAMKASTFGGILWHQGESNCNEADVLIYKAHFIEMITQLRKDLHAEYLPVLIGELSEVIIQRGEYPQILNNIFHEIAQELPYCAVVSATGLTLKPDQLHFNSVSLREFGRRYFAMYRAMSLTDKGQ